MPTIDDLNQNRFAIARACTRRARQLYRGPSRLKSGTRPEKLAVLEQRAGILPFRLLPRGKVLTMPTHDSPEPPEAA